MALFLSRSTHKVDRKGRVSVPAAFRAALGEAIGDGIALTKPLNRQKAIEATPMPRVMARLAQLDTLKSDSPQRAAIAMVTLGNMRQISIDGDGRMILPEDLMAHAGISDMAVFVGLGHTFQVWEASALDAYMSEAEAIAEESADMLPSLDSLGLSGPGA